MTHLRNFLLSLFLSLCGFAAPAVADNYGTGQVFTMTNAAGGNAILIFNHHPQQGLVGAGSVATGGDGTGAGLGNQGGVILSKHHRWLYAVNAGSDSVSVFRVRKGGLTLIDTIPSDGSQPVSLTRHGNLLYVLNAGSDSIAGFTINDFHGKHRVLSVARVQPRSVSRPGAMRWSSPRRRPTGSRPSSSMKTACRGRRLSTIRRGQRPSASISTATVICS